MTMFFPINEAEKYNCPLLGGIPCQGTKCMHFMFRQYTEDGRRYTDPGKGMCGWLYALSYFRDKNTDLV